MTHLEHIVAINILWLFLMVPWVGVQCVIVVFHYHTHLLFITYYDIVSSDDTI